ncbi:MAG: methyltransferase domain-containing protein [Rhodospirillales bacterium]|nr:methyltransferase domain-containing protein [Rhodospirillales bacterium]MDH3911034.1 methyltransferase domain-containing protein [Rhodospirillales bacterium]MDH3919693.1 methyltransferase domain-containing protein [Rhodospirillales bacterium]MDH3967905.1 methyltransferase domain-containing protein [Rhodospirillales bacterium]
MPSDAFFPATGMPDSDWWSALWPDPEGALRALGIELHMTVIDLCCGDGHFTAPLARLVGGRVYGVDLDPAMLDKARAAVGRAGAGVRKWIRADAMDLARLIPEKADFVLIANTFHGVPDQTGLSRGAAAVLKPGGAFAIVNWHPLPREKTVVLGAPRGPKTELRMAPEQVRAVVEPAGFEWQRLVELPPYHYGAVFHRIESD